MNEFPVLIVGGGPTGMMLAGELALAGVEAVVVEQRRGPEIADSRAGGLHSRTIEVLDQRGIADRFLSAGTTAQVARFNYVLLDISDFPTRHPYGLALWQKEFELILSGWVEELGVLIRYGSEVTGLVQDDSGVDVHLADGERLRAHYVVGCDGGRSLVRKSAGIDFAGSDATVSNLVAEVEFADQPTWGLRQDEIGTHGVGPLDGGRARIVVTERELHTTGDATLAELREAMVAVWGTDFGVHSPTWISRFTDATRQAATYRAGRVVLAGDAAHIHYPVGGQGLNLGVQDAVNLGWKLGQVVNGISREDLLDTYDAERRPVAALALRDTMAQVALRRTDDRTKALSDVVDDLLTIEEARNELAARMSGLGIRYDLGEGHPLLGRRMPDLDLGLADGSRRVFELLHAARPVLLNFGEVGEVDVSSWADRVRAFDVAYNGAWVLPVLGEVAAPSAVLIRPDGYVAWVGAGASTGLDAALTTWFGASWPRP